MTARLMNREQAAAYCGLSPSQFDAWISAGRLPGPLRDTRRYDRHAIDRAIDLASGLRDHREPNAYDAWKSDAEVEDAGEPETHSHGAQAAG